jgi:hypothetical protein
MVVPEEPPSEDSAHWQSWFAIDAVVTSCDAKTAKFLAPMMERSRHLIDNMHGAYTTTVATVIAYALYVALAEGQSIVSECADPAYLWRVVALPLAVLLLGGSAIARGRWLPLLLVLVAAIVTTRVLLGPMEEPSKWIVMAALPMLLAVPAFVTSLRTGGYYHRHMTAHYLHMLGTILKNNSAAEKNAVSDS